MIFFGNSAKERELIKRYHEHYEILKKKYEVYKTLHNNVLKLENKYQKQITFLQSKRKSLHEANLSILKAKNTISMIAFPKVLSNEEYDNFVLYNECNEKIKILKAKLEKGYEIIINHDPRESTTYMFMFQNVSNVAGYKIYSQSEKMEMEEEIKSLTEKLDKFSLDQVNFFENQISWKNDIEKRLKRFSQFEEEHNSIREATFQHLNNMRVTKKDLSQAKTTMESYYNIDIKKDKETLNDLYSSLSLKDKKNLEKKQNSLKNEDFSM